MSPLKHPNSNSRIYKIAPEKIVLTSSKQKQLSLKSQKALFDNYLRIVSQFKKDTNVLISLMEQNDDGVFIKDTKGRYLLINQAAAKILGNTVKGVVGKQDKEILSEEDYKIIRQDDKTVLLTGRTRIREEILTLRGEKRTYLCTKGVLRDEKNRISGIICLCRDITENMNIKKSLQKSEEQFKNLFNNVPIGVYRTTPNGKVLMANPAMLQMLHYSSFEEFSAKNLEKDFFEPIYKRSQFRKIIKKTQEIKGLESRCRTKDGKIIYIRENARVVKNEAGKVLYYEGTIEDITERKAAEDALSKLGAIIKSTQDSIISTDMEDYITSWNLGAEKLYGYKAKEAIGKPIYLIIPREKKEDMKEALEKIKKGGEMLNLETIRVDKDGIRKHVSVSVSPIKDSLGKITGLASIARDITHSKLLESELRFQKKLLELQSEASIEGILMTGVNDAVISHNSRFLEMWNIPADSLINVKHQELLNLLKDSVINKKDFIKKVKILKKYPAKESTEEIFLKNGKIYERYTTPIQDYSGKYYGRVWYFHDITESKLYEKQREMLIAVAGHELKTPITSIKAFTQILHKRHEKIGDNVSLGYIERMDDQIERLIRLTRDLLDVIKIRGGKLKFEKDVVNIEDIVRQAVDDMQKTTKKHRIKVIECLGDCVFADKNRIDQVLDNLLSNAIKYSPNNKDIFVQVYKESEYIRVDVEDHGVGVPETYQEKIFHSFMRLTSEKDEVFPGLGMGLYIASEIIKEHGGKIWVDSKKGKGSIFSFTLPIYKKNTNKFKDGILKKSLNDHKVITVGVNQ